MEAERGVPNYELQVSFSATPPPPIHEMGFVQFEDHSQVLSFLAHNNNNSHQSSATATQPLNGGAATTASTSAASGAGPTTTTMGFCHGDLSTRPSWNSDQVIVNFINSSAYFYAIQSV